MTAERHPHHPAHDHEHAHPHASPHAGIPADASASTLRIRLELAMADMHAIRGSMHELSTSHGRMVDTVTKMATEMALARQQSQHDRARLDAIEPMGVRLLKVEHTLEARDKADAKRDAKDAIRARAAWSGLVAGALAIIGWVWTRLGG